MATWHPFDEGRSLGTKGSEEGIIIHDEEFTDGARITIERDGAIAPYSITMGIYGAMFHTRFCSSLEAAEKDVVGMKKHIETALAGWNDDDRSAFNVQLERLLEEYP